MKQKSRRTLLFLTLCIFLPAKIYAPLPNSRDADFAENLSPTSSILIQQMQAVIAKLCQIADNQGNNQDVVDKLCEMELNQEASLVNEATMIDKLGDIADNTAVGTDPVDPVVTKGTICINNNGGPAHDDEMIDFWDNQLIINDTVNSGKFVGVSTVKICEPITYRPTIGVCTGSEGNAAIVIEKDDLTLDLTNFTITLDTTDLASPAPSCPDTCMDPGCVNQVYGIRIAPGVKNTRIISSSSTFENTHTRGSLKNFSDYGIFIDGTGNRIEEVYINNIRIYDCGGGIFATNASNVNVTRTEANNNCRYNDLYGMRFQNVSELYVVGCQASSNQSCNNVCGISLEDTCNAFIQDTQTNKNSSQGTIATSSAYGIHISGTGSNTSSTNRIVECTSSFNSCGNNASSESVGILVGQNSVHNSIDSCLVLSNNVSAAAMASPPNAFGIKIESTSGFNEITKNKVGCNGSTTPRNTPATSWGIIDENMTSSSLFTANTSYFNGMTGEDNFNITFVNNASASDSQPTGFTVLYAADLEAAETTTSLTNLDIKKSP